MAKVMPVVELGGKGPTTDRRIEVLSREVAEGPGETLDITLKLRVPVESFKASQSMAKDPSNDKTLWNLSSSGFQQMPTSVVNPTTGEAHNLYLNVAATASHYGVKVK